MDQQTSPPPTAEPQEPDNEVGFLIAQEFMELLCDTMRMRENEDPARQLARREATIATVLSLRARDPVDMMFATHAIASHHAAMECLRRAMRSPNNPEVAARMQTNAIALSRHAANTVDGLARRKVHPAVQDYWAEQLGGGKTP